MGRRVLAALLAAVVAGPAAAQVQFLDESFDYDRQHPAAGYWLGNVQPGRYPDTWADLEIKRDHTGAWSATITILTAGAFNTSCESLEIDGSSVACAVSPAAGGPRFVGTVSADGQRLAGTIRFEDGNGEGSFELARMPRPMDLARPVAFTGFLEVPQLGKLEITFVFAETPGGNWVGHADVPAQALVGFPLINVTNEAGAVTATLPATLPAVVDARIEEDERRLVGRFKQGPFDLELSLPRNDTYVGPILRRPQHPGPPFPYHVRPVRIEHPDGHALAATVTVPQGSGPFPAAILISGSGPQDRDEQLLGHRPFLVIADHLTRNGIAVLRYDDRGTAQSTGTFAGATSEDFATDALAVLRYAASLEEIDGSRIGLIGHSEGGLIAPLVAGLTDEVAFIVMLAGPGVRGDELLRVQGRLILEASAADDETIRSFRAQQERVFELILAGAGEEELHAALRPVLETQLAAATGAEGDVLEEIIEQQMQQLGSPWMRFFITYDPQPALSRVRCPVLALNGTLDLQVWHDQNLPAIKKAMAAGGGDLTVKRYDGLNHLFQPAHTGSLMEYAVIETTFDEAVLADIVEWIARKLGR